MLASHGCIYSVLFALQCLPVESISDRHISSSKCLDIVAIAYSNGALSILEDIAILILPFPEVWYLNMDRRHRLALLLLFSIACLVQYTVTLDSTWDNVDIVIWSFVEQITMVFCASLPTLRQLLGPLLANKVKSSSLPPGGITVTKEVVIKHEPKAIHQDTNTGQDICWY
ncbi:uncharacterized protein PgNI_12365 [Pyricularia grisea]|uniref:Rhodopsin domain-containing protein n=1 Tax=Pyricularia grisea TaxID=148305 RepID=A0A6P8AN07_PYRGI|nr:uncharacterized protein PgNI_12365 [Pyricularia grisea]TLD03406.1 hypothetical protein PgNI_12365 [Pyricularia grisea]